MSVRSALFDNRIYNFEQAFGAKDITTRQTKQAIDQWYQLYYLSQPTKEEDPSQRLPLAIVSKLTKTAFSEYQATVGKTSGKADFLQAVLLALAKVRKQGMQQALIGGQCYLKPIFAPSGLCFGVVERRNFLVLGRNERNEITDLGTTERTVVGGVYYTLLERRTIDPDGYLSIASRLYQSGTPDIMGNEVPLATLEQYAALAPVNRLSQPLWSLGLIPIKTPMENCVDGSADCVSIYAGAVGLIRLIYRNEAQLNGEFSRGESRIIVSSDLMARNEAGERSMRDHVFSGVDDDPEHVGITIFSPALREQSFLARKMEYLRNVESVIGLKRGILSQVEATERTATEITSSAGDYNLSIIDLQQMWESAVREAVRVCDVLGQLYQVCDKSAVDPEKDIILSWGNGILYDEAKVGQEMLAQVQAGILKPERYLAWYYNLPCETQADLEQIRLLYMPELERLVAGE